MALPALAGGVELLNTLDVGKSEAALEVGFDDVVMLFDRAFGTAVALDVRMMLNAEPFQQGEDERRLVGAAFVPVEDFRYALERVVLLVLLAHRPHQEIKHGLGVLAADVVVAAIESAGAMVDADVAQHAVAGDFAEVVRLVFVKLRLVHDGEAFACLQVVEDAIGRVNLPHVVWMAARQLYVWGGAAHLRAG